MKLSILLYCADKINESVRCIKSVLRQQNANIDLQLIFDNEKVKAKILDAVKPFSPRYTIKGDRTNKAAFEELLGNVDSDFFMMAFYNQVFTVGFYNELERSIEDYDGAVVNFSYRRNETFYKTYNKVSYSDYFNNTPRCYNIIFKTKVFKENPVYFRLGAPEQAFLAASYFSFAKKVLFLDTVFYYKDSKPLNDADDCDLTYNDIWWLIKIATKLKKSGNMDCAASFAGLYLNRFFLLRSNAKGIIPKLRYFYYSKKLGNILF